MSVLPFPRSAVWPPCFVRVRVRRPDGFIEFDFSMGDPSLAVELILPPAAFEEFCTHNKVRHLSQAEGEALDAEQATWQYGPYGSPGLSE